MILFPILALALLALDQWVKNWIVEHLPLGNAMPFLPGFVELKTVHNYGAAWSSFSGQRLLLIALPVVIIAAVIYVLAKRIVRHPLGKFACALVLAGGVGNLIDRVFVGYVVDMLYFPFWVSYPTFNIADICIVVGAVLGSIYYLWIYEAYDMPKKEEHHGDHPAEGER